MTEKTKPTADRDTEQVHTELRRQGAAGADDKAVKPAKRSKVDLVSKDDDDDLFNDMPV
jgi:hypothetical protein